MKKNLTLWLLAGSMVVLLAGAGVLYKNLAPDVSSNQLAALSTQQEVPTDTVQQETQPSLQTAPDFTVYDARGQEVKLSQFFGKPIVLNFWASWCGPCKMEMPDFQAQYEALGEDVHFLMVNMTTGRETTDTASDFLEEVGYTFPVYFDTQASAATTYGVYSLPTTYFIDAQGVPIAYATGALSAQDLQTGIQMIYTP